MSQTIKMTTKHHTQVDVDLRFANLSNLIKTILDDSDTHEEIPVEYITSETLSKILEYAQHHDYTSPRPIAKPVRSKDISELVEDPWDAAYIRRIDQSEDELYEFLMAVNYLDIKCLLDLCLAYIACKFVGKTVEEVREEYNIEQPYTPEIDQQLQDEYGWALEVPEAKKEATG